MIVMADWVDEEMFDGGRATASERLGEPPGTLRLERFDEGRSVQIMHVGPEEDAIPTMARLYDEFQPRRHRVFHEIYLSDPKRVAPEKMRTVLRQPVAPVGNGGSKVMGCMTRSLGSVRGGSPKGSAQMLHLG